MRLPDVQNEDQVNFPTSGIAERWRRPSLVEHGRERDLATGSTSSSSTVAHAQVAQDSDRHETHPVSITTRFVSRQ